MASQRASSSRHNSSRTSNRSTSISSQMRVTKPRGRSDSAKEAQSLRSSTRTQSRPQYRESSEDDEPMEEEEDDFEESTQTSPAVSRRSARAAASTGATAASKARANRATARENRAEGAGLKKVATGRIDGKTARKRGRPPKPRRSTPEDESSPDETSEDGSDDETDGDDAMKSPPTSSPAKRRRGRPSKKKAGRPPKINATLAGKTPPSASEIDNSIIPNWLDPRMEHAIWVQVFRYAAISGEEEDVQDINWLLATARVCRDFVEPALTVLYRRPPVKDEVKAQRLAELLEKPPSMTAINYRAKIEALHIDVRLVSLQNHTPATSLMQSLPRLSEVLLSHGYDQAPYRKLKEQIKWTYPADLWKAFEPSPTADDEAGAKTSITRLQSWQWSSRLMDKDWEGSLVRMKEVHQTPSFTSLRKIKLVNYQLPSVRLDKDPDDDPELVAEDERSMKLLAESLTVLENLEHLVFESSTIVCTAFLPLLPIKLKRLELVNCAEVTADNLGEFLISNGHQLEALVLNHNRSLSLAFLTVLGTACPHLQELRANFKYFSLLETVDDNEPFYDHLLLSDQVPSWPPALETLHLENLRNWDMNTAKMFLHSLIDSASVLPMLRYLSIKAMLDIPWRERSDFRKSWQEKFEKVFLRPITDPEPNFSLRMPADDEAAPAKRRPRKAPGEPTRRSNRVVPDAPGRSSRGSSSSRGLRTNKQKPKSYREPDSDEFDSEDGDDADETVEESEDGSEQDTKETGDAAISDGTFVQGLCTFVDINIDNQKPREHQYGMEDFLNDERDFETDDEWNGDMDFE
ncbi:hypothetical protein CGCSCA1_v008025 [Colletotrichum siamense]|nr:hypothetical protein CGCSCA1_v008025 [Colletotrichum siamense]